MESTGMNPGRAHRHAYYVSVTCGLIILFFAMNIVTARAAFEQVKTFGGGDGQLRIPQGTAINTTGAGGVPAGTVYMVAQNSASVVRYTPQGEFREAWGWGVANKNDLEYQRCGPDGEPSHPTCEKLQAENSPVGLGRAGEELGELSTPQGIAVDQSTGNVYVFNRSRQTGVVQVFSADGSQRLGGFGVMGKKANFPEPAESIEEGPEKIHRTSVYGSTLTVDDAGRVYLGDGDYAEAVPPHLSRVMVFEPETPGDYEHYVYAGRSQDLENQPTGPIASDYAGHIYTSDNDSIFKLALPSSTPICKFDLPTGGITGIAVDPESEEVYYINQKKRNIHRLVCNGEGKFTDLEAIEPVPKEETYTALAFNPATAFDGSRPPGILYAVLPENLVGTVHVLAPGAVLHPLIESQEASEVSVSGASLHAVINPKGAATDYVFQYISNTVYQANEPSERFVGAGELPAGSGHLQSGVAGVPVAVVLSGLEPGTQYHFRVVAENCTEGQEPSLCTSESAEETFRTFPDGAGGMPDRRAYELVSPAQKNGGQVYPASTRIFTLSCLECKPGVVGVKFPSLSSPDGEKVAYEGDPFSFTEGAPNDDAYVAVRTESGWKTTTMNPSLGGSGSGLGLVGYDDSLSEGVLYQGRPSLTPSAPGEVPNLYTLPTANPATLSPLLSQEPPNTGAEVGLGYAGSSKDLGHIFFSANDALTEETSFAPAAAFQYNRDNLYEYHEGQLRLVNVLPGNTQTVVGATIGSAQVISNGAGGGAEPANYSHAISSDGSRAFWSDPSGQVYVRVDGISTRELSDHTGHFQTASADGSKVLLTDGKLIDLENGESSVDLAQGLGGFRGIAGQSEDLSRVYFVDTAVLDEAPNSEGDGAAAGQPNLYLWEEGATTFIATFGSKGAIPDEFAWAKALVLRNAAASPNGRWLAFMASEPLTGHDNVGPCGGTGGVFEAGPCSEVFLYDAAGAKLTCVSCSPTEEGVLGFSHLASFREAQNPPPAFLQQRFITDSGRLFFDSPNRLSPSDTNNGAEDVYEYEPKGVGTCDEAGGCVSLVSPGDEFTDANLLTIDPSGKNAFFTTREQLSLRDQDELFDLYDAREGGGIAGETETIRTECQGEACQPPILVPSDPTPGSSTFQGAGNVVEKAPKSPKKKKKHKKRHHHKKKLKSNRGGGK